MDKLSRFKLVETPALLPGECWFSGTPVGPFIDTGMDVPFEKRGRVYISIDTLREMAFDAGLFEGLVPEEKVQQAYDEGLLVATKENLGGSLDRLADELAGAADRIRAVRVGDAAGAEAARG